MWLRLLRFCLLRWGAVRFGPRWCVTQCGCVHHNSICYKNGLVRCDAVVWCVWYQLSTFIVMMFVALWYDCICCDNDCCDTIIITAATSHKVTSNDVSSCVLSLPTTLMPWLEQQLFFLLWMGRPLNIGICSMYYCQFISLFVIAKGCWLFLQ